MYSVINNIFLYKNIIKIYNNNNLDYDYINYQPLIPFHKNQK